MFTRCSRIINARSYSQLTKIVHKNYTSEPIKIVETLKSHNVNANTEFLKKCAIVETILLAGEMLSSALTAICLIAS